MKPLNSGVYEICCLVNGKVYVGSTQNLKGRKWSHFYALKKNKHQNRHLQRAFNKYGEDAFLFSVLKFCPIGNLLKCEQYYIDKLAAFGRGFNQRPQAASNRGNKHSQKTKEKMSSVHKGCFHTEETKRRLREINIGKTHSDETRQKLSEINIGKTHSDETKKKMSDSHKGKVLSNEGKKKVSIAQRNRSRVQRSEAARRSWETRRKNGHGHFSVTMRRNMALAQIGKHHTEEAKKKVSVARMGMHFSDETKKKMSNVHKQLWQNSDYRNRMSEAIRCAWVVRKIKQYAA